MDYEKFAGQILPDALQARADFQTYRPFVATNRPSEEQVWSHVNHVASLEGQLASAFQDERGYQAGAHAEIFVTHNVIADQSIAYLNEHAQEIEEIFPGVTVFQDN